MNHVRRKKNKTNPNNSEMKEEIKGKITNYIHIGYTQTHITTQMLTLIIKKNKEMNLVFIIEN